MKLRLGLLAFGLCVSLGCARGNSSSPLNQASNTALIPIVNSAINYGVIGDNSYIVLYGLNFSSSNNVITLSGDTGCQGTYSSPLSLESSGQINFAVPNSTNARTCTVSLVSGGVSANSVQVQINPVL